MQTQTEEIAGRILPAQALNPTAKIKSNYKHKAQDLHWGETFSLQEYVRMFKEMTSN